MGVGECAPGTGFDETLAALAEQQITDLTRDGLEGKSIHEIWQRGRAEGVDPSALAALDIALWDLLAKKAGMPLYRLFGLSKGKVETSVTIGINPPEVIRERVPEILTRTGGKALKIKLGSPDGIETDQINFMAAKESSERFHVKLRVDANGGWNVAGARTMLRWLADRGVDYVEQPLAEGCEEALPEIFKDRPLPIFVDESCRYSTDVPKVAHTVDGVNMKLMKCGGLTEALRIVATARAHKLKTMIGCMGESSVAIAAGVAISALLDHIDLDAHLNLSNDPGEGLTMVEGVVTPPDVPGHGATLKSA